MDKQVLFLGSGTAVNLAQVMAFERVNAIGVDEVLKERRNLRVILFDDSDVVLEADEDIQGFMSALDNYLESM